MRGNAAEHHGIEQSSGRGAGSEHFIIEKAWPVLAHATGSWRSSSRSRSCCCIRLTDTIGTLERRFYDFGSTSGGRQPSDRIAVIAIDDQSIANIGRWPWTRDVHAQLIDQLAAAKAKTIVYTTFFFEPQTDRGLVFIRKLKDALGAQADGPGASGEALRQIIAEAEQTLDTDAKLAASIQKAGNVLLPSVYLLGEPQGKADQPLPSYVARSAIDENSGFSVPAIRGPVPDRIDRQRSRGHRSPEPAQ